MSLYRDGRNARLGKSSLRRGGIMPVCENQSHKTKKRPTGKPEPNDEVVAAASRVAVGSRPAVWPPCAPLGGGHGRPCPSSAGRGPWPPGAPPGGRELSAPHVCPPGGRELSAPHVCPPGGRPAPPPAVAIPRRIRHREGSRAPLPP